MKVAIVGGGASGALTAAQMLRRQTAKFEIVIYEPRAEIGLGLAYSTTCDGHLLNVPASRMSGLADQATHFAEYATANIADFDTADFAPRKLFGKYVQSILHDAIKNKSPESTFEHKQTKVAAIEKTATNQFEVRDETGSTCQFDAIILALGNLPGHKPGWLHSFELDDPAVIFDPWDARRMDSIAPSDAVLLVGAGLTAVDKLVELHERKHQGQIYAVSRHGFLPRPHIFGFTDSIPASPPSGSVRGALRHLRENGKDSWRAAIDGMRPLTQDFWFNLPLVEKRRFMRHAQTLWDVHRHRMAPRISEMIEGLLSSAQLRLYAGRVSALRHDAGEVVATIKLRNSEADERIRISHIINCTGPQAALRTVDSPLLSALLANGLIAAHETGYGLNCDKDNHIIDRAGATNLNMYAIGPLMKAVLFETVAMPEIKVQANKIAEELAARQKVAR